MAKTTTALGPLSKLLDGDTGQLLGIIDAEGRPFTPLPVLDFTAAELSAMATAGTLTPLATYVASDDPEKTQQYAQDAYTLVPAAFNRAGAPWEVQAVTNSLGTQVVNLEGREAVLLRSDGNKAAVNSVLGNGEQWTNLSLAASVPITASITGNKMTVTAVGVATNPNGGTLPGYINRGHYITTVHADLPVDTYVIYDPTDTGDHGAGIYTLSAAAAAPIASQAFNLSCAQGVGGVLERVYDTHSGPSGSADTESKYAWRLTIDPTHRVTLGHGRGLATSNYMYPGRHYRGEMQFRFGDAVNCGWQLSSSANSMVSGMAITGMSITDAAGYGPNQYTTNGPFGIVYERGALRAFMRTPDEEYAKKVSGFWEWGDGDRYDFYDQECYLHYVKGQEPIKVAFETFLDGRMKSEGGRGWLKCWINNRLVLDFVGPTCYPAGAVSGVIQPVNTRLGMYDISYPVVADNTLCSAVRSTTSAKWLIIKYWRVKEVA